MAVNARNFDDSNRGQGGSIDQLPPAFGQFPRLLKLAQQRLEADLLRPLSPKARAISRFPTTEGDV